MGWVWDHSTAAGSDLLVLLAIADSADHDGTNAWPSLESLARKARIDRRNVRRCVRRLEELGELRVELKSGGPPDRRRDRRTNRYTVVMSNEGAPTPSRGIDEGALVVGRGGAGGDHEGALAPPDPSFIRPEPSGGRDVEAVENPSNPEAVAALIQSIKDKLSRNRAEEILAESRARGGPR